jgi:hypothetical protein
MRKLIIEVWFRDLPLQFEKALAQAWAFLFAHATFFSECFILQSNLFPYERFLPP